MPTKWLQNRTNGSKTAPGIPPHRAFCGVCPKDESNQVEIVIIFRTADEDQAPWSLSCSVSWSASRRDFIKLVPTFSDVCQFRIRVGGDGDRDCVPDRGQHARQQGAPPRGIYVYKYGHKCRCIYLYIPVYPYVWHVHIYIYGMFVYEKKYTYINIHMYIYIVIVFRTAGNMRINKALLLEVYLSIYIYIYIYIYR